MGSSRRGKASSAPANSRGTRRRESHSDSHLHSFSFSDVVWGLVVGLVFLAIKVAVWENTTFGKVNERLVYEKLQGWLPSDASAVAVIDIKEIVGKDHVEIDLREPDKRTGESTKEITVTPPGKLLDIIAAAVTQGACAIGVDINFAPYEASGNTFLTPAHEPLFEFCKKLNEQQKVAVRLGVYEDNKATGSDVRVPKWLLNSKRYKGLFVWVARGLDDPRGLELEIKGKPTIGAALARAYMELQGNALPNTSTWYARPVTDLSAIEKIQRDDHTMRAIDGRDVERKEMRFFERKMVLIGCASADAPCGYDTLVISVADVEKKVPGVYFHACVANTLVNRALYELTSLGRVALDGILTLLLIAFLAVPLVAIPKTTLQKLDKRRLRWAGSMAFAAVVTVLGLVFFFSTRFLWSDFIVVIPALLFHSRAEHYAHAAWSHLKGLKQLFLQWLSKTR